MAPHSDATPAAARLTYELRQSQKHLHPAQQHRQGLTRGFSPDLKCHPAYFLTSQQGVSWWQAVLRGLMLQCSHRAGTAADIMLVMPCLKWGVMAEG